MSLTAEERHDVVEYRLEKAGKTLEEMTTALAGGGRFSGFCVDIRTDIRKQANISVLFL